MTAKPRHAAIGAAAAALTPLAIGARAAAVVWRSPLGAPVRGPADAIYEAAAHRGELIELRLRVIVREELEYRLGEVLDDPRLEPLIDRAFESRLVAVMADRLRESDELSRTVESIATSDAVRSALQSQSTGLAREVADGVRMRTADVDNALERTARRLLRRPRRPDTGATVVVE